MDLRRKRSSSPPAPRRFAALRKAIPSVSQNVLRQQLRELIDDEIVQRRPHGAVPAPVEYSLTDYGRSLLPLVEMSRCRFIRPTANTCCDSV